MQAFLSVFFSLFWYPPAKYLVVSYRRDINVFKSGAVFKKNKKTFQNLVFTR